MNTGSILYIEDEEDYQLLVKRILGKVGFHVVVAETAQEGLSALRHERPQLLLLDINLPDMEGYEICSQLRKDPAYRDLPILMLTVRRRPEEWLKGFSAGTDDYVSKPLNPPELIERVCSCIEGKIRSSIVSGTPEFHLLQAARGGNRAAYEVMIQEYKTALMSSLLASGRSATDADDAVSAAFIRAYEKLDQFRGESSFFTWLHRIAQNEAMQLHRGVQPSVSLDEVMQEYDKAADSSLSQPDTLSEDIVLREQKVDLHRALSEVPRPFRAVLEMHILKGMSYEAIARRETIPVGTVMSRLFKARKLFQEVWAKQHKEMANP